MRMAACAVRGAVFLAPMIGPAFMTTAAQAQIFAPGPGYSVPGSSVSGMRIDGAPPPARGNERIRGSDIGGHIVEERVYGRDYDDSHLKPAIPKGQVSRPLSTEELASEGGAKLDGINAGVFARQGPNAIGRSEVTRGSGPASGRAIIRRGPTHRTSARSMSPAQAH